MSFDVCDDGSRASLLRGLKPAGNIILIATTGFGAAQMAWVANAVASLHALGLGGSHCLLTDSSASCDALHARLDGVLNLTCAYCGATTLRRLRLRPGPGGDDPRGRRYSSSHFDLLFLRWVVAERVLSSAPPTNVLMMDLDVHMVASPYAAVRALDREISNVSMVVEWDNTYLNSGLMLLQPAQAQGVAMRRMLAGLVAHLEAAACASASCAKERPVPRGVDQDILSDPAPHTPGARTLAQDRELCFGAVVRHHR